MSSHLDMHDKITKLAEEMNCSYRNAAIYHILRLRSALAESQWTEYGGGCWYCRGNRRTGHDDNCEVRELLSSAV